jgi:hypothetical protein
MLENHPFAKKLAFVIKLMISTSGIIFGVLNYFHKKITRFHR